MIVALMKATNGAQVHRRKTIDELSQGIRKRTSHEGGLRWLTRYGELSPERSTVADHCQESNSASFAALTFYHEEE